VVGDDQNGCLPWVKGRLGDYVSITAGCTPDSCRLVATPKLAESGQLRTSIGSFRRHPSTAALWRPTQATKRRLTCQLDRLRRKQQFVGHGRRRRVLQGSDEGDQDYRSARTVRVPWHRLRLSILQPSDAGRSAAALRGSLRRDRPSDSYLQHSISDVSVNLSNDTLLRLAGRRNIVGVKDSSGGIAQSLELLARRPTDFSVLTGEDSLFFTMICNGADGGILAAAHLATEQFVEIARLVTSNDHVAARTIWSSLRDFIPRLFREANPMPIKYCLWRQVSSVRPSAASHCHRSPKGLHGNSITGSRKLRLLRAFSV